MKKVISLVAGALFVCALFFNVSLIQNENGDNSLSLDSLQTAQAQDGEGICEVLVCVTTTTCWNTSSGQLVCRVDQVCYTEPC